MYKVIEFFRSIFSPQTFVASGSKCFSSELLMFANFIKERKNFSLVRFGDGEMMIIDGQATNLSKKKEHVYSPESERDEAQRNLLYYALTYKSDNYYVGISCPACVGQKNFEMMHDRSNQHESNLTFSTVFVNSNYRAFRDQVVPLFNSRNIIFVGREESDISGLPFGVDKNFTVGENAWINDHQRLLSEIIDHIDKCSVEDAVFIFCAGVLSNILIYQLIRKYPNNTYIDMGSVFDVDLGLGKTRKYLRKGKTLRHTCVWGN